MLDPCRHICCHAPPLGTLWKGNELIPGVREMLAALRARNKKVLFVTNNSSKSRKAFLAKFDALSLPATADEIYGSAYAGAMYLKSLGFAKKAYVVGAAGIMDELTAAGITALGGPADGDSKLSWATQGELDFDRDVGAVVVGVDPLINYYKITYASLCLLHNPGCVFVATNTDARGHFSPKQEWPGAGSAVGAIKAVVETEPTVVGKPAGFLLDLIMEQHGLSKDDICMVGDRLDTDIQWGNDHGFTTLLVMTGVTTYGMVDGMGAQQGGQQAGGAAARAAVPTYTLDTIADLTQVL
jgi:phosphoglycolate phosphatase